MEQYIRKRKRPDMIYCAVPSLTGAYRMAKYCRKNNVKFIIDVQDLWPEAFRMVFNIPLLSTIIFFPFRYIANSAYKCADEIVAVSDTYANRALSVNTKCKTGTVVYLGTDLEKFDTYARNVSDMKKQGNEFWIGYCGTLGSSYDLKSVIDAIALIKDKCKLNIKFMVMGDGPRKLEFSNYAKRKGINACFLGRLPYDRMCSVLADCDIAVNPITHGAAQSIINKHADYAAAGIPVINTQECKEYKDLVEKYNMGYNCENEDEKDIAEKLQILISDMDLRKCMGDNARRCAEELFDRNKTYDSITNLISNLV